MSRKFYSDFAWHCLRYYVLCDEPSPGRKPDYLNWNAAQAALADLSDPEREVVIHAVKQPFDDMRLVVRQTGIDLEMRETDVWAAIQKAERCVAIRRELI